MAHAATTGRGPWGLAGMLAVVALTEALLASRDLGTTTHLVDSWTEARAAAVAEDVRASAVLCLGDSQVQQGVLPDVLGERLGVAAYGLAVQGGQPAAAEALLRRALDAGAKPRAIVVGFFPGLLASDLKINLRQWPEIVGPLGALDLAWTARDVDLGVKTLLGIALKSYRSREQTRADVRAAVRGEASPKAASILADRRERRARRGGLTLGTSPAFVDDVAPAGPPPAPARRWKPKPENDRALRRLLGLAESRGIAVYWVTTTLSPGARAVRAHFGLDEGYLGYLRRLQDDFAGLTVLDVDGLGLDRSAFRDPCHLDARAAARLSGAVADAISAAGPRGRWVRLAPAADDAKLARGGAEARPAR